jgi:hypothetical protein
MKCFCDVLLPKNWKEQFCSVSCKEIDEMLEEEEEHCICIPDEPNPMCESCF